MVTISKSWFPAGLTILCVLHRHIFVQSAPLQTAQNEGSGAPIIGAARPQTMCSGQEWKGISQKLENIFITSRAIQEAIFGSVPSSPIAKIGLYSVRSYKQIQSADAAIADSVQYFMCFVQPVADGVKNETYRAIIQRAQGKVYAVDFVYLLSNLSVAKDLYELVQHVPLNLGRTPNVTNSTAICSPIIAPTAVSGITAELTYVGAIASELSNLSDDIRVQLTKLTC
ncbi:hypothetical protein EMCRGX_G019727 [Ephydatia muelleri]